MRTLLNSTRPATPWASAFSSSLVTSLPSRLSAGLASAAAVALLVGTLPAAAPAQAAPGMSPAPATSSADTSSKTGLTFAPASLQNPRTVYWNKHANWTEHYFTTPDGTTIHADVLRPKGIPDNVRTPVIMSVGPYFNHLADLGLTGIVSPPERGLTLLNPTIPNHPNPRFKDFILSLIHI